jgi:hypothetical protein
MSSIQGGEWQEVYFERPTTVSPTITTTIPNQWWKKSFRFKKTIESRPLKMIIDPRNLTNNRIVRTKQKNEKQSHLLIEDDLDDKRKNCR